MCVDADMTDMTGTEIKAGFGDAARFTIGSQTMDGSIGCVVVPRAVFNDPICWLVADDEGECPHNITMVKENLIDILRNIVGQDVLSGIIVVPLGRVAVSSHIGSCSGKDL